MNICHLWGALPGDVVPTLSEGDVFLAVDGGYAHALHHGITPHLSLGDFDSLGYVPDQGKVECLPCIKDDTDMAYALKRGEEMGYRHFFLQGALGGRLAHSLGNIQLLCNLADKGHKGILLGEGQSALILSDTLEKPLVFPSHFQGYCSLFALGGEAVVSLAQLAYEGVHLPLSPAVPLGVSNQFIPGKSGQIQVHTGRVLVLWEELGSFADYLGIFSQI